MRGLSRDARAAMAAAPGVARVMAAELGWGDGRIEAEVRSFRKLAEGYVAG